jgi:hypothetical protein
MATLIGYIKEDIFRITEYERIECENDAEALTKGRISAFQNNGISST